MLVGERNAKRKQRWLAFLKSRSVPSLTHFIQDTRWDAAATSATWLAEHHVPLCEWLQTEKDAIVLPILERDGDQVRAAAELCKRVASRIYALCEWLQTRPVPVPRDAGAVRRPLAPFLLG